LVSLQLDVLLSAKSKSRIRAALETLPATLDAFYEKTLLDIDEAYHQQAAMALRWIAFAARPPTLSELAEAMINRPTDDPCFDPDDRFMDVNEVLHILPAGLIAISEIKVWEEDEYKFGTEENVLQFAHFSVLEYLGSVRISDGALRLFHINKTEARENIAEACIKYLNYIGNAQTDFAKEARKLFVHDDTQQGEAARNRLNQLRRQLDIEFALATYANRAWHYHVRHIDLIRNDSLIRAFLTTDSNAWTLFNCCARLDQLVPSLFLGYYTKRICTNCGPS
jgi:hypothetical protein